MEESYKYENEYLTLGIHADAFENAENLRQAALNQCRVLASHTLCNCIEFTSELQKTLITESRTRIDCFIKSTINEFNISNKKNIKISYANKVISGLKKLENIQNISITTNPLDFEEDFAGFKGLVNSGLSVSKSEEVRSGTVRVNTPRGVLELSILPDLEKSFFDKHFSGTGA